MEELKPCPFCGSENVGIMTMFPLRNDLIAYYAKCFNCGARTAALLDEQLAIEAWNRRGSE